MNLLSTCTGIILLIIYPNFFRSLYFFVLIWFFFVSGADMNGAMIVILLKRTSNSVFYLWFGEPMQVTWMPLILTSCIMHLYRLMLAKTHNIMIGLRATIALVWTRLGFSNWFSWCPWWIGIISFYFTYSEKSIHLKFIRNHSKTSFPHKILLYSLNPILCPSPQ